MSTKNNPIVGDCPCDHVSCDCSMTVHQVLRGKGKRGMFYTRCPDCGCDQSTGVNRQKYILDNTRPRPGHEGLFEGAEPVRVDQDNQGVTDETETDKARPDAVTDDQDGQEDQEKPGIAGLLIVGGLAAAGLLAMVIR